jgi:hypothetical protein
MNPKKNITGKHILKLKKSAISRLNQNHLLQINGGLNEDFSKIIICRSIMDGCSFVLCSLIRTNCPNQ